MSKIIDTIASTGATAKDVLRMLDQFEAQKSTELAKFARGGYDGEEHAMRCEALGHAFAPILAAATKVLAVHQAVLERRLPKLVAALEGATAKVRAGFPGWFQDLAGVGALGRSVSDSVGCHPSVFAASEAVARCRESIETARTRRIKVGRFRGSAGNGDVIACIRAFMQRVITEEVK